MSASKIYQQDVSLHKDLPFIRMEGDSIVNYWDPVKIEVSGEAKGYDEQCAIGTFYAIRAVEHEKEIAELYGSEVADTSFLTNVIHAIVLKGQWTGVEIGFVGSLGEMLLSQRCLVSASYIAQPIN